MYTFEVYLVKDEVTKDDWNKLYNALLQYGGVLNKFSLTLRVVDNDVRWFISFAKDISSLGSSLNGMIIKKANPDELQVPKADKTERFTQFSEGANLLDFKEKYSVKRQKEMEYAVFNVRPINANKAAVTSQLYFKDALGNYSKGSRVMTMFPSHLFTMEFGGDNARYLKKSLSKYLNIEKSLHILDSSDTNALFSVDGFPYLNTNYYLNLNNYEFDKHSFIVGASGSGKSKLIELYIDRLAKSPMRNNYRVIVIDPHAALHEDLKHIDNSKVMNFAQEGAELFSDSASTDVQASTELTTVLFRSLMSNEENARLERVLRFSLFVLFTAQNMSLDTLKRFLTDVDLRNQILEHVKGYVPDNIIHFFGSDFNEIKTQHYNEAIQPIIALVDEMQLQPSLVSHNETSLLSSIQSNFLTVFSLNKVRMGEKVVKTVAGLLIQQIFLLAQSRAINEKLILVIDEVSVVQNPALAQILAESRKFNMSVVLSQQYFGQIEKDLQDAIFANVMNYYAFKVSEEDARALEGNLSIELPTTIVEAEAAKGIKEKEVRVKMLTDLHPRECLVRLAANGQLPPALKARTVDVDFEITEESEAAKHPDKVNLTAYQKMELPTKFEESAPSPELQTAGAAYSQDGPTEANFNVPVANAAPRKSFNLSTLLSEHSSSRFFVNKRKAKK